jgi:hypothetical protein
VDGEVSLIRLKTLERLMKHNVEERSERLDDVMCSRA